jgi:hypothetical protein
MGVYFLSLSCYTHSVDPEVKKMMEELVKLTRENNALLLKVRGHQRMVQIYKAVYWFIILMITFGGLYFIKPFLNSTLNYYSAVGSLSGSDENKSSVSGLPDIKHLQDLINQVSGE